MANLKKFRPAPGFLYRAFNMIMLTLALCVVTGRGQHEEISKLQFACGAAMLHIAIAGIIDERGKYKTKEEAKP